MSSYREEIEAIDVILGTMLGVNVIAKALDPLNESDFDVIIADLTKKLKGTAEPYQAAALKSALKSLNVDWPKLSPEAHSKVIRQANKSMLFGVERMVKPIKAQLDVDAKGLVTSVKSSAVAKFKLNISPDFNKTDARIAEQISSQHANFITDSAGIRLEAFEGKAKEIVSRMTSIGRDQFEIREVLAKELAQAGRGEFYWETVASSFANRGRVWTQIHSFKEAGFAQYIWTSVLDEHTTETCRFLHNKTFPIDDAVNRFSQVEQATQEGNFDAVKDLQPWVRTANGPEGFGLYAGRGEGRTFVAGIKESAVGRKDEIGSFAPKLSDKNLIDGGMSLPPIHGLCRSTVLPDFSGPVTPVSGTAPVVGPPLPEPPKTAQGKALAALDKLKGTGSIPSQGKHTMQVGIPDLVFEPGEQEKLFEKAKTLKPNLYLAHLSTPYFNNDSVRKLLESPELLKEATSKIEMIRFGGKLYVLKGSDAAVAHRLLGSKRLEGKVVDYDKILAKKPPKLPLVKPSGAKSPAPGEKVRPAPTGVQAPREEPTKDKTKGPDGFTILGEKISGAQGSNDGGFYRGKDGVERYVKFYNDGTQSQTEHLANQLYRDLGIGAPESTTFDHIGGKKAYASTLFKDGRTLRDAGLSRDLSAKAMKGFAADVFTANWDAAGMNHDNMMVLPGGNVVRIDNGGTFLFRAQAGRKPPELLNAITEWDRFLSGGNASYHKLSLSAGIERPFDVSSPTFNSAENKAFRKDLIKQIQTIQKLEKKVGGWGKYVDTHAPGLTKADRDAVVGMLESRSELLSAKADELKKLKPAKPVKAKPGAAKRLRGATYQMESIKGVKGRADLKFEELPEFDALGHTNFSHDRLERHPSGTNQPQLDAKFLENMKGISPEQRDAIVRFTNGKYTNIRLYDAAIHASKGDESAALDILMDKHGLSEWDAKEARRLSKHIQEVYEKKKAKAYPQTVFRGIDNISKEAAEAIIRAEVTQLGKFNVPGTSSSSWDPEIAVNRFMAGPDDHAHDAYKVFYMIHTKSAIGIQPVSEFYSERELLIKADAKFRTVNVARQKGSKRIVVIELEEID